MIQPVQKIHNLPYSQCSISTDWNEKIKPNEIRNFVFGFFSFIRVFSFCSPSISVTCLYNCKRFTVCLIHGEKINLLWNYDFKFEKKSFFVQSFYGIVTGRNALKHMYTEKHAFGNNWTDDCINMAPMYLNAASFCFVSKKNNNNSNSTTPLCYMLFHSTSEVLNMQRIFWFREKNELTTENLKLSFLNRANNRQKHRAVINFSIVHDLHANNYYRRNSALFLLFNEIFFIIALHSIKNGY